ncbi:unnamed protein product [Blepharisma stoltei]|uniref:Uncharacterized protein n=1 Tax=Blepharisma stoltei TaxID=1481888 RepID=A0AAU9JG34_9CILI|nr:unnamed protein product [Blepharisma stoltei]
MESKATFEQLLLEIEKQEETINGYLQEAEEQGSIDPSFEEYLSQAKLELQKKREELLKQQELAKSIRSSQELISSLEIQDMEEKTPIIKRNNTNGFKESSVPTEKYPFYSVQKIEPQKPKQRSSSLLIGNQPKIEPEQIFKKKINTKSNSLSPSARRYEKSPQKPELSENVIDNVYTPAIKKKKIPIIKVDETKEIECEDISPEKMHKSAISDFSNISSILNDKDLESKMETLQWYRELRNSAHEKMLELKEQILLEKEKKLQSLVNSLTDSAKSGDYLRANNMNRTNPNLPPLSPKRNKEILLKATNTPKSMRNSSNFQDYAYFAGKSRSAESSPSGIERKNSANTNIPPTDNSNFNQKSRIAAIKKNFKEPMPSIKPDWLPKKEKISELVKALPGIPSEIVPKLVQNINKTQA